MCPSERVIPQQRMNEWKNENNNSKTKGNQRIIWNDREKEKKKIRNKSWVIVEWKMRFVRARVCTEMEGGKMIK